MAYLQTKPYVLEGDAGTVVLGPGLRVSAKATSLQTGGGFNLLEVAAPAGAASPLHIHYAEDVAVFVLEGSLTVFWGDEGKAVPAGSTLYIPRGTPHGFRVPHPDGVRVLYVTVPGGFDGFAQEHDSWTEATACIAAAARYKIEILGPLPE